MGNREPSCAEKRQYRDAFTIVPDGPMTRSPDDPILTELEGFISGRMFADLGDAGLTKMSLRA